MSITPIVPDQVYQPGASLPQIDPLDPCPVCGMHRHEAPEGKFTEHHAEVRQGRATIGDPVWVYEHCWKCGYRPGTNVAISQEVMKQNWERFQAFLQEQMITDWQHKSLNPPQNDEIALLKQQLEDLKQQVAGAVPVPNNPGGE